MSRSKWLRLGWIRLHALSHRTLAKALLSQPLLSESLLANPILHARLISHLARHHSLQGWLIWSLGEAAAIHGRVVGE